MIIRVIILLLIVESGLAQNKQVDQSVNKLLESYINIAEIPALSVCVSQNGKIVYSNAVGYSDVNTKLKANDSSLFRIGSVTKLFTALTFVKLAESGNLKKEDFIAGYVNVPENLRVIHLEQLAAHTSGIRHYGSHEISSQNEASHKKLEDALGRFINDTLVSKPGDKYVYSSYGYILLGAAIENQQKKSFNKVIDSVLLSPIKLSHTHPEIYGAKTPGKCSFYYAAKNGFSPAVGEDYSYKWPAGGYLSTPADLVKLGNALLEGKIINESNISLMLNSQKTNDGKETGVAFAFKINADCKGRKVVYIGGEAEGARTFLLIYPEEKLVIAVCANVFRAPVSEGEVETIAGYFLNDYGIEKNILPGKPYKFMTKNEGREIEGDLIIDGKKGIIIGLTRSEIPILDIVKDKGEIRIIAISHFGIINIWLTPDKNGYKGKWGHEKPMTEIKMM